VYSADFRKHYMLEDDAWKYDIMPEILDGHNVMDFVDPDIEAKLDALEREEEELQRQAEEAGESEEHSIFPKPHFHCFVFVVLYMKHWFLDIFVLLFQTRASIGAYCRGGRAHIGRTPRRSKDAVPRSNARCRSRRRIG
jgi:hypothetical protein